MNEEKAECGELSKLMQQLGKDLDQYLRFDHPDPLQNATGWQQALGGSLPEKGVGIDEVMQDLGTHLIPNGSQIPNPGCTSFITTGATSVGALATVAGAVAAPQRGGLTAFNYLEELSLQWLVELFNLAPEMKGLYSSGGSVANLVALGAARQWAFERVGVDPARDGVTHACVIYATEASHHTIHRAAAVLGIGRRAVVSIASDALGRMDVAALASRLEADDHGDAVPIAVVANAGTTSTGAIDPLRDIGELAQKHRLWFHVDGAYGLPGILDPQVAPLYDGLQLADSVIVDPHKWLGAPVGIGATFVRDRGILNRAFTQGPSDYLEGSFATGEFQHSMDSLGIPYFDFGVELSAPSRGAVVWALLREIGREGMQQRICRHNGMAKWIAKQADEHPNLEVVAEPTLSICCFRYAHPDCPDINALNRRIHRQLIHNSRNMPSTAMVDGSFAIRPCFVGARTNWEHAQSLVEEVIEIGNQMMSQNS